MTPRPQTPAGGTGRAADPGPVLISAVHSRVVAAAAARAGVSAAALLAAVGPGPPGADPLRVALGLASAAPASGRSAPDAGVDTFVPASRHVALWDAAARLTGDDAFGAHAGAGITPEQMGVLGYVLRASATLGDALAQALRYERLMTAGFVTTVQHAGGLAVVRHAAAHPGTPEARHPVEYTLALVLSLMRALSGAAPADVRPLEVRFRHAAPGDAATPAELARVFAAPVHFGQADNALVLPAAVLALAVRGGDHGVAAVLTDHADGVLARVAGTDTTRGRVRGALADLLRRGADPSLAAVARSLAMSERTLQRRLAGEGVAFQPVLDDARRELALGYLQSGAHPVGEVAFLTGFSEPRAFRRAFRRWTGRGPGAYAARS